MSQYVVPINEKIDSVRADLESACQTEDHLVCDLLEVLQDNAEELQLSSEEYLAYVESSLVEMIRAARAACIEICGHCNEEVKE